MNKLMIVLVAGLIASGCASWPCCKARSPIQSSSYAAETKTLTIGFPNGSQYEYAGVPAEIAQGLDQAKDRGAYFNAQIKGKYEAKKVSP